MILPPRPPPTLNVIPAAAAIYASTTTATLIVVLPAAARQALYEVTAPATKSSVAPIRALMAPTKVANTPPIAAAPANGMAATTARAIRTPVNTPIIAANVTNEVRSVDVWLTHVPAHLSSSAIAAIYNAVAAAAPAQTTTIKGMF